MVFIYSVHRTRLIVVVVIFLHIKKKYLSFICMCSSIRWSHFTIFICLLSLNCVLIESKNETVIHAKIDNREIKLIYRTWLRPDLIEDGEWFLSDGAIDCPTEFVSNIIINESSDIDFPPNLFNRYPETIQFTMTHNHLKSIDASSLLNAASLLKLNLSHNEIDEIAPFTFDAAPKLTEIDLSFNLLSDLNENLFGSYLIKYLYLHNNQLTRIDPIWFENLIYLRILTLNNNRIHTIDWIMLMYWPNINVLHLHTNEIVKIEKNSENFNEQQIDVPRSMQTFTIHNNPLDHGSHDLMWLNVNKINVQNTSIDICMIGNRMANVNAANNKIRKICLDNLAVADENAIVTMDLANNQLKSLENLTHFHHLQYLDASNNLLTHIPTELFRHLNALNHLNLANNQLKRFDIGNVRLPNLNFLDVSNNEMLTLHLSGSDGNGGVLSQLKTLLLDGNRLQATDSMMRTKRQIINHEYQCLASNSIECDIDMAQSDANKIITNQMNAHDDSIQQSTNLNDEILSAIYEQFHIMEKNILLLIDAKFHDIDQRLKRLENEMIRITADTD